VSRADHRLAWAAALALACVESKGERGEGAHEDDVLDTALWPGPPPGLPTIDWSDLPADFSGQEVCYPGSDGAYEACIPTVDHSDEWGPAYDYPPPLDGDPQYSAPVRYIDLSATEAAPSLKLAPNFQLDELMQEHKGRFALFQVHTVETLQQMRDSIGGPLYINSAYRNVDYNAGVGGATWSRHQYGDAVDIRSDHADLDELADICADLGAGFTSIYTSHVHCDWRDTPLDASFYDDATAVAHVHEGVTARFITDDDGVGVAWTGFDEGTPRIEWTGFDADGLPVAQHRGERWTPDGDVVWIVAEVGRVVTLSGRTP